MLQGDVDATADMAMQVEHPCILACFDYMFLFALHSTSLLAMYIYVYATMWAVQCMI
jgi:hypothetical protein